MQLDTTEALTQFAPYFHNDSETIFPLQSSTDSAMQETLTGETSPIAWANLEDIVLQMKSEGALTFRPTTKLLTQIRQGRDGANGALPGKDLNQIAAKAAGAGDLLWGKFLLALDPLLPRQLSKKAAQLLQTRIGSLAHFGTES